MSNPDWRVHARIHRERILEGAVAEFPQSGAPFGGGKEIGLRQRTAEEADAARHAIERAKGR